MRQKSTTILGTVLVVLLFAFTAAAEEQEIRTTGGAFAGKYKFQLIESSDALLEFPLAGRTLHTVTAGFVANSDYREVWEFENSCLVYDKLPRRKAFRASSFNERSTPIRFCDGEVELNCDVLRVEKLSKNLIVMTYRDRESGAACAGLEYIDQDRTVRGAGLYGNYNVLVGTCLPASNDHKQALALSAHYLSLIKNDGKEIIRLSRYDLPKPDLSVAVPVAVAPMGVSVVANVRRLLELNTCVNCDLRGANLFATDHANANLSNANLGGALLTSSRLNGANLAGANIGGGANLNEADFSGANLTGADFRGTDLDGVNFTGANLTGARFGQDDALDYVNFSRANLDKVDLTGLDLSTSTLRDAILDGAILCKTKMPWGEENSGCK
jgi:uncharacterized protein YjbI with pentapeptide repeats